MKMEGEKENEVELEEEQQDEMILPTICNYNDMARRAPSSERSVCS